MDKLILFFATDEDEASFRLLEAVKKGAHDDRIEICRNFVRLANTLIRTPHKVTSAVLLAKDQGELSKLVAMHKQFKNIFVVIVLPDEAETTMAKGQQLNPIHINFKDSTFTGVTTSLRELDSLEKKK